MDGKIRTIVYIIIIVSTGLACYINTFNVPFIFDDKPNIIDNPGVRDYRLTIDPVGDNVSKIAGILRTRTVGYLSFALNYRLHGLNVRGYHALNLAIHITNAVLIYLLIIAAFNAPRLSKSALVKRSREIALFAALLFVAHPVQTQAVTYIVQRFASLAALFYLSSLLFYIKSRTAVSRRSGLAFYILSLLAAVMAMKTKENAFTLPFAIALYEFMFLEAAPKERAAFIAPMLLTAMIIPFSLLNGSMGGIMEDMDKATRLDAGLSRFTYFITELRVIITYLRLLVLPYGQNLDYDYPVFDSLLDREVMLSALGILLLLAVGVYFMYRAKKDDPVFALISFGILWFFITLSVESGIIPIADVIFEHRLYLPGIGIFLAAAAGLGFIASKMNRPAMFNASIAVLTAVLAFAAYQRNDIWKSELSLWADAVSKSPNKARPHYNLGKAFEINQRPDLAIKEYLKAVELKPDYFSAHMNLGNIYLNAGDLDRALHEYQTALDISPESAKAHVNVGIFYRTKGRLDIAMEHYKLAIALDPALPEAHYSIANAYAAQGAYVDAVGHYGESLRLRPWFIDARYNLAQVLIALKRNDTARAHLMEILDQQPGHQGAMEAIKRISN